MSIFKGNLAVADRVLTLVRRLLHAQSPQTDLDLTLYVNGREQGYALTRDVAPGARQVWFSENRSSDHIIVYYDVDTQWSAESPTEEAYAERLYIDAGKYELAAQIIVNLLVKGKLCARRHRNNRSIIVSARKIK